MTSSRFLVTVSLVAVVWIMAVKGRPCPNGDQPHGVLRPNSYEHYTHSKVWASKSRCPFQVLPERNSLYKIEEVKCGPTCDQVVSKRMVNGKIIEFQSGCVPMNVDPKNLDHSDQKYVKLDEWEGDKRGNHNLKAKKRWVKEEGGNWIQEAICGPNSIQLKLVLWEDGEPIPFRSGCAYT